MPFSILENGIIISKNEKVEYLIFFLFIIMLIQLITDQLLF